MPWRWGMVQIKAAMAAAADGAFFGIPSIAVSMAVCSSSENGDKTWSD